jgi:hypothetical protein
MSTIASKTHDSLCGFLVLVSFALCSTSAMATITQGDLSIFGNISTRWSGRWGEASARGGTPSTLDTSAPPSVIIAGTAPSHTGGSFDFNHWDLVQARTIPAFRADYHFVKNYNMLGRFDTLVLHDADFFAYYRAWYDAFPDLKHRGRAETARDWTSFTSQDRIDQFTRNELREYYGQLNFTDNFSMRIGKQEVIWSEADALSGTEVTNPSDLRFHWTHFEAAEDTRVNLQMVKFNYILPDFLGMANNELEWFWIPGDFQGSIKVNSTDARNPWIAPIGLGNLTLFNQQGQPFNAGTLLDQGAMPMTLLPPNPALTPPAFADVHVIQGLQDPISHSIDNSEFGVRYSTLFPIGNGLQTSFIYLYEARSPKLQLCANCPAPPPPPGTFLVPLPTPGVFFYFGTPPTAKILNDDGVVKILLKNEFVRQSFVGVTGTYYDKDLTDIVFRYDILYAPKTAGGVGGFGGNLGSSGGGTGGGAFPHWVQQTRFIVATDRPTYIPWLSKQHTFLTAQYTATWGPDTTSSQRALNNLFFVAATNWLINGQLNTLNVFVWDPDANVGYLSSGNTYRYSRNVTMGLNAIWYLGRSGFNDDGFGGALSRAQRINEIEFRLTYEI